MRTYSAPHFQTWPCCNFIKKKSVSPGPEPQERQSGWIYFFFLAATFFFGAAFLAGFFALALVAMMFPFCLVYVLLPAEKGDFSVGMLIMRPTR
jgi:hypothetical protein